MTEQSAVQALKEIKKGIVHKLYLLFGSEGAYLKEQIITSIKNAVLTPGTEAFDHTELRGDSTNPLETIRILESPPFGQKRLVVLKNAEQLKKSMLNEILKTTVPAFSVFIVVSESQPKVSPAEKDAILVKDYSLTLAMLRKWIKEKAKSFNKKIEKDAIEEIINRLDHNLYIISSEIKKLSLYVGERKEITTEDVKKVVEVMPQTKVFSLVDAIVSHRKSTALKMFNEIVSKENVAPEQLLALLLRTLMQMLMIKELYESGNTQKEIAQKTGIYPSFVVGKLLKTISKAKTENIEKDFRILEKIDVKSKKGEINLPLALRLFIENL